jgi:phosphoribosylformylglycinamidine synthase subunit PurL
MLKAEMTPEKALELGIGNEEFILINEILGRGPNFNELVVFAALWSDAISHKNSIAWLRTLPHKGNKINAGLAFRPNMFIKTEGGHSFMMKIHNPGSSTQSELRNYAAIAVAKANQGIFTNGARPVSQLHSFRFGDLSAEEVQIDVSNIIRGVAEYEHALEVPVAGDDVVFDEIYRQHPVVNVMSAGLQKNAAALAHLTAGSKVFVFGAFTRKDCTSLAGTALKRSSSSDDLPAYDPYLGKLLLDASDEIQQTGVPTVMQAITVSGVAAASAYLASKCNLGIRLNLEKIPQNKTDLEPIDLLLSETSERILLAVESGSEEAIHEILSKWAINHAIVGELTEAENLEINYDSASLANLPLAYLISGEKTPVNELPYTEPVAFKEAKNFSIHSIPEPEDLVEIAQFILKQPNIVSKKCITDKFRIYEPSELADNLPNENELTEMPGSEHSLMFDIASGHKYVKADPEKGSAIALVSSLRNMICQGAKPLALCFSYNGGNAGNPENYWKFVSSVKGIAKAARKFDIQVTHANVAFDQNVDGDVAATPIVGLAGWMTTRNRTISRAFRNKGDMIFLLGESRNDISSSEYLASFHHVQESPAPFFDLDFEAKLCDAVSGLIHEKLIRSAAPVGLGGLFMSLVESGMPCELGYDITTDVELRNDAFLFGESQGRVVVSVPSHKETAFIDFVIEKGIPVLMLGHVTKGEMRIDDISYGFIADAKRVYDTTLEKLIS